MIGIDSKQLALMAFTVIAGCAYFGPSSAAEPLALKLSWNLGQRSVTPAVTASHETMTPSLLGKVNLFRGVVVEQDVVPQDKLNRSDTGFAAVESRPESSIKAIYGGVQVSLRENLSLVYTPGRLSRATLNTESQGLYLLSNRGGLANWFLGVESSSYSTAADSRQIRNSAQFGVIISLN